MRFFSPAAAVQRCGSTDVWVFLGALMSKLRAFCMYSVPFVRRWGRVGRSAGACFPLIVYHF